jgi:hypothetical protein
MSTRIVPSPPASPPVRPAPEQGSAWPRSWRAAVPALLLALAVVLALGVARGLGATVRRAALIETRLSPPESGLEFSDSPAEAVRFFAERDEVTIRIPRDMTVAELLALYHLGNRPDVRTALREQLNASDDADLLREGEELTIRLTPTRESS